MTPNCASPPASCCASTQRCPELFEHVLPIDEQTPADAAGDRRNPTTTRSTPCLTTCPPPAENAGDIIEAVITKGDLAKLTPQERVQYY